MPKEYTKCVEAAVKGGKTRKAAKAMCAATYYKRHGMTVTQAHKKGVEEVINKTGSLEDLKAKVQAALDDLYQTQQPDGLRLYPYIRNTYIDPQEVVFELDGELYALDYEVDEDGKVTLGTDRREVETMYRIKEESLEQSQILCAKGGKGVLLEVPLKDFALEEVQRQEDGGMRFLGTALVDNTKSANRRFYSKEANDAIVEATNAFMESSGIVTIYSRHGKAIPPPGGAFPTGLPVGKIPRLFREGDRIRYEGEIYPTSEGKDVMTLVERGAMRHTSIRAHTFKSRLSEDESGNIVENIVSATIAGIDLCDEAGIAGAGIDEVLEEAPQLTDIRFEEVTDMDLKELTLEQLKEHRPDLLDEHAVSVAEALKDQPGTEPPDPEKVPQLEELEGKLATVLEEQKTLTAEKDTWEAEKADLEFKLEIQEAAQIGAGKAIAKALTEKVEKAEDLEEALPEVRKTVLEEYMASLTPEGGDPEGKQRFETEDQKTIREKRDAEKEQLTEEQTMMIEFAGGRLEE